MTHRNESLTMKLARFRRSIMREAENECAEIDRELAEYKERELSAYREILETKNAAAAERETARLRLRYARELSARRKEYRERLLLLREEYMRHLRESTEARLLEYSQKPEYREFVIKKARALAEMKLGENVRLLIKSGDENLSAEIEKAYGGGTVEISGEITLGGILLICESARIIADETLDSALNKEIERFRSSGEFDVWLAPLGN